MLGVILPNISSIELMFHFFDIYQRERTEMMAKTKNKNKNKPLSDRQNAIYSYIKKCIRKNGYAPSVRDISNAVGLASPSSVHVHLKTLEDRGLIKRNALKSRCITLTEDATSTKKAKAILKDTTELPLVGNVAAGTPILADQNIEGSMVLPREIVGDSATFMLSVHGDSMVECGINDGDYVVVKEQKNADNGDIVVAIIDDEATVKRFYKEKDKIRLQPENSSMKPIYTDDCSIAGKVVAVFRSL